MTHAHTHLLPLPLLPLTGRRKCQGAHHYD
jgi:hypothetical protein